MGFFDFASGDDYSKYFDEAGDIYKQYEQKAMDLVTKGQAQGRTDITGGYDKAIGFLNPYMGAGNKALGAYMSSMGLGPEGEQGVRSMEQKFKTGFGYNFALQQAMNSVKSRSAAAGIGRSGAEAQALQQTGTGMAEQSWQDWVQNYQNRLAGLAGMGQQTAGQAAGYGMQTGLGLGQLGMGYTQMGTGIYSDLAKAMAEEKMAKAQMEAQQNSSFWSGLGGLAGGIGGWMVGGPIGGMAGAKIGSNL